MRKIILVLAMFAAMCTLSADDREEMLKDARERSSKQLVKQLGRVNGCVTGVSDSLIAAIDCIFENCSFKSVEGGKDTERCLQDLVDNVANLRNEFRILEYCVYTNNAIYNWDEIKGGSE